MQRIFATCITLGALGVACCYAQSQKQDDASTPTEIAALQQKRIELLQQRVSRIESAVKVGFDNISDLIQPQIDLINARLDYAQSNAEKRKLLTDLLAEYDKLIQIAKSEQNAPIQPRTPNQRSTIMKPSSDLLWLKSERIRIQIARDILN